jgi:hypothetical protein
MKQTAVEWLYERFLFAGYAAPAEWKEKAKEMEKQQIINAYSDGINHDYTDLDIEFGIGNSDREYHAEQYYKQTYKQ